jgi:periplasmic protein TonB
MPQYPGGNEAMMQYISKHLRRPKGSPRLSGPVRVTFTVLQNGTVTKAHVKPGNGLDARYDTAAVAVISGLKGFKAGERDGQPADVELTLPVEFR